MPWAATDLMRDFAQSCAPMFVPPKGHRFTIHGNLDFWIAAFDNCAMLATAWKGQSFAYTNRIRYGLKSRMPEP
jgi:hypothetical protein